MAEIVEVREHFTKICDAIERSAKGDGTIRFVVPSGGGSIAIAAKSIVLVQEVSS